VLGERECVKGTVQDLIDVAEGFHERRIVSIADEILSRSAVRFICLAGPSSSGKTTFLKRLTTQLRVLGKNPRSLSLDDYYRARSETPRDAQGKVDFEAFDALDVPLLQSHLRALVEGRAVTTARYDFETQTSHPNGGTEIRLGESDVMIIEGLHGLHPGLFAGGIDEQLVFRAFVNVATPLPFDALTEVSVSDVRLIRRIVRDRRQRATTAAENIARWPLVRAGERENIFPHLGQADAVFDSSLVYELCALKVFAERYLLEVPRGHASYPTALRLRGVLDAFVAIETDHVPPTSLLREFVGSA
jgi:uridine kinase